MSEEWRPAPGWAGTYEVSNLGRVRRTGGGPLRNLTQISGHQYVALKQGSRQQTRRVHRLVAEAFIPNPQGHPFVLHWDDDPRNNHVSNLRWGSRSDNALDSVRNGKNANTRKTHCPANHPYTLGNTRMHRGSRYCRRCNTLKAREYKTRKRLKEEA